MISSALILIHIHVDCASVYLCFRLHPNGWYPYPSKFLDTCSDAHTGCNFDDTPWYFLGLLLPGTVSQNMYNTPKKNSNFWTKFHLFFNGFKYILSETISVNSSPSIAEQIQAFFPGLINGCWNFTINWDVENINSDIGCNYRLNDAS